MQHFVHPSAPGRLAVAYMIPGTNVASVVTDAPVAARAALQALAVELSREGPAYLPPEERPIPRGFYGAEQGDLF